MTIKRENEGGLSIEVRLPLAASEAADTLAARDGTDAVTKAAALGTRGV
jgi:hypothetical protein